ncbi:MULTISPECIES: LysR family transcriptional regulator [Pseudoalteromonas]|uniref:LysR family transcriptional regulator n=1 Tax=Pseudoalteromonas obscura TaxID=3048491 RepID=A0ABT7ELX0_9GAMM|nr:MULTISPECIES: LysR family transcriptional regulator [Pseudoalteromonas]MBQ4837990.1 LysR family transcriptional regulator [Pseudoalteromonas luteoviolacea]MDK2596062.1 LysR family transcriptional regulator [Pseudoalteromonas sp. P94(2023)]
MNHNVFDGIPVFVKVVQCNSFALAAEQLSHSPSHVSKVINRLEARLGVRLLNRTTRTLALTPDGEVYYQHCVQLLSDAEQTLQLLTHQENKPKGVLKISCPVAFSLDYLRPAVTEYLRKYPNVTIEWELNDRAVDVVGDGFDLAIRATTQLEESSLICKRIYRCRTLVVASPKYIERYGKPHHPRELSKHHCICYSNLKHPDRWEFTDQAGKSFTVDVRKRANINNGHMQAAMAIDGIGISRLPEFYLADAIEQGQLEILLEAYLQRPVEVYVVYPSRKHLSPKVRYFIDILSSQLAS